ncbi:MAG: M14 family metallopeptidase [Acidobacteria bacterium]|nr:M14 family metallopeptidase [Acidobacteriota bacterium]
MSSKPLIPSSRLRCAVLLVLLAASVPGSAAPVSQPMGPAGEVPLPAAVLPPELPWEGASRSLMAAPDDPWITPAEKTGLEATPGYDETLAWLDRLVAAAPQLTSVEIGRTDEGRPLRMIVASSTGVADAAGLAALGKPILLAHGGIHAGEIDGKDAGMMLLRDLTVGGKLPGLLERASLLFIPVLNPDGHERSSAYGRVNQRGPREMGWRTNGRNLNLNRDFAKLDTPEVRALVRVIDEWRPDLYVDVHVTDGADYQYDCTYGWNGTHAWSPAVAGWLDRVFRPAVDHELSAAGHQPGPLVFLVDEHDPARGNLDWAAGPRYSNGYGDVRHLASILVENHSLKPYDRRVLGTYVFLAAALRTLGEHGGELRTATVADRAARRDPVPLSWTVPDGQTPRMIDFLGVESRSSLSPISGGVELEYTGKPVTLRIPQLVADRPGATAARPKAYWLPPTWPEVIARLEAHGIRVERQSEARDVEVDVYRLGEPTFDPAPFEGRFRVAAPAELEHRVVHFAPGSVRVPTNQPLGDLAVLLLEPASPDSFLAWGFFHEIFQRTEYIEGYVVEPLARAMLEADADLETEFEKELMTHPDLAGDARARLSWFYAKTPYWDQRWRVYPVARE